MKEIKDSLDRNIGEVPSFLGRISDILRYFRSSRFNIIEHFYVRGSFSRGTFSLKCETFLFSTLGDENISRNLVNYFNKRYDDYYKQRHNSTGVDVETVHPYVYDYFEIMSELSQLSEYDGANIKVHYFEKYNNLNIVAFKKLCEKIGYPFSGIFD